MPNTFTFATKLPKDLTRTLNKVCEQLGLRKNFVVETALREKLEDLMDTYDLQQAIKGTTGFKSWEKIKHDLKHKGCL
mgnify:CR=1 FL=1